MSDYLSAGILALIQGATEYLPISSSAHLIMVPNLLGLSQQALSFDIAVHVGTLIATIYYFRSQLSLIIRDCARSLTGAGHTKHSKLGWMLILASIPLGVAGLLASQVVELHLRNMLTIAITTLVFGLLLWYADWFRRSQRDTDSLSIRDVIFIGLAQAIAIIPGTSRSGVTMTACMMLGMTRQESARFAFLLAIPAITMVGIWQLIEFAVSDEAVNWLLLGFATAVSGVVAWLVIHLLMQFIEKIGMLPFVIYRIVLAGILLILVLGT